MLTTAAMDEASKNAWCREHGVYPRRSSLPGARVPTQALAEPAKARATLQQTKHDKHRIKELERELRRKDKALAETTALLVLSRKLEAVFNKKGGRMICLEDRQNIAQDISKAHKAGARLSQACQEASVKSLSTRVRHFVR